MKKEKKMSLDDIAAKNLVQETFDLIKQAKTNKCLENIFNVNNNLKILSKYKIKSNDYPQIKFRITQAEIDELVKNKMIEKNYDLSKGISSKFEDPIAKLLYAIAWKNGDLKKLKHIIKGILDSGKDVCFQKKALVFYQFGKYLTKKKGEPIIDQHVIRAFAVYWESAEKVAENRTIDTLNKSHQKLIDDYKKWLTSDEISNELKKRKDYSYHIDTILFALGKAIKRRKTGENLGERN